MSKTPGRSLLLGSLRREAESADPPSHTEGAHDGYSKLVIAGTCVPKSPEHANQVTSKLEFPGYEGAGDSEDGRYRPGQRGDDEGCV